MAILVELNTIRNILIICLLGIVGIAARGQAPPPAGSFLYDPAYYASLENTHDLNLPAWGPYSKRYNGIAHVPDRQNGLRFDVAVVPGYYRRKLTVPNVNWESGYHPWTASADLSHFSYRYELEWKDQVYCEVSFNKINADTRLMKATFVNRTGVGQHTALDLMASLNLPPLRIYSSEVLRPLRVLLPQGAVWIDALDYDELVFTHPRPTDRLVPDGFRRGEVRTQDCVGGSLIGRNWGRDPGDRLRYPIKLPAPLTTPVLAFRYRLKRGDTLQVQCRVAGKSLPVRFIGTGSFELATVALSEPLVALQEVELISAGGASLELDGFVAGPRAGVDQTRFTPVVWNDRPQLIQKEKGVLIKYDDLDIFYGIAWKHDQAKVREFLDDHLDEILPNAVNDHVNSVIKGNQKGHFTNIHLAPFFLSGQSEQTVELLLTSGSRAVVEQRLADFSAEDAAKVWPTDVSWTQPFAFRANPAGQTFAFSQNLMAANLLTAVIYPIYTQNRYILHNTPGRWWDCLYTWDCGFQGIGLSFLDLQRAIECLNTYTTPPGSQSVFLHHGTPLPIQILLYQEIWNKTQSRPFLAYFYPRLKQMHDFLAGRIAGSTTRQGTQGLIRPWDYFYNSGGWDDYPAQVALHQQHREATTTPVVNTAMAIRTAKILRGAAMLLGYKKDLVQYDQDIRELENSLQKHAWDEASG